MSWPPVYSKEQLAAKVSVKTLIRVMDGFLEMKKVLLAKIDRGDKLVEERLRDLVEKSITFDGERTLTIAGKQVRLAVPVYKGIWNRSCRYERGDLVTLGGSIWHCNASHPTDQEPGNGPVWTLSVKAGRDAR